jgi:hypothetical protein
VFTSTRSGDLELWTCALDGSDLRQVTQQRRATTAGPSSATTASGWWFRATAFTPGQEAPEIAQYQELLRDW